ncbi:uncharacterized protein CDAR_525311 [Caerostris darwini]|uniref:Uncharacterized protein n=1 Tax=Caerostris darwini TaxID=1538125 RepID=A0AAV4RRX8_9ARAC|nr:uncharacterized protein CDAR_525311 [Caerostris darwini]
MEMKGNEKMKVGIFTKEHRLGNISRKPYKDVPISPKVSSPFKFCQILWKWIFKRGVAWQMVKNAVFFACCSFFFIQSKQFYNHYYTYPTTTNIAVVSTEDFKLPAITFCDKNMPWSTTFVRGGNDLPYVQCYSRNLHIFTSSEPEIQKLYGEKTRKIQYIYLPHNEYEAFYPWIVAPIFFSIHSSVIPENPLTMGKRLRLGHQYKVTFRLEEEHLLPLPYATNCTDYDALWRQHDNTGPRSQEMCVYMCLKRSRKLCPGCEGEQMMHKDKYKLFPNPAERCLKCFYYRRKEKCKRDCNVDCVKQKYHYTIEETPLEPTDFKYSNHADRGAIEIQVYLIDRDVTVISHIPRYGMWELFSYIGGLIGCWLGISVWAFVDIIEGNCRRLFRLIQKLKQKPKN